MDLSEEYWNYRDSIVQAELLTMRMISFKTINPDTHLVSYISCTWRRREMFKDFCLVYAQLPENTGVLDSTNCLGKIIFSQTVLDFSPRPSSQQSRNSVRASTNRLVCDLLWTPGMRHHDPLYQRTRSNHLARGIPDYWNESFLQLTIPFEFHFRPFIRTPRRKISGTLSNTCWLYMNTIRKWNSFWNGKEWEEEKRTINDFHFFFCKNTKDVVCNAAIRIAVECQPFLLSLIDVTDT